MQHGVCGRGSSSPKSIVPSNHSLVVGCKTNKTTVRALYLPWFCHWYILLWTGSTPASKHCSNAPSAENHGMLRTSYTELLEKPYFARIGRAHATQFVRETRARSVWRPRDSRGLVRR
eukprot:scaffold325_cov343-Pavlova_lutheri.AAC.1